VTAAGPKIEGENSRRWTQINADKEAAVSATSSDAVSSLLARRRIGCDSATVNLRPSAFIRGYSFTMQDEASYICGECGEEIVVPVDLSAGSEQEYVEDCPVCCRANVIRIEVDEDGEARAWGELE
jgi:DNA-directed RNA polymerase subunit RPC12/RpoP